MAPITLKAPARVMASNKRHAKLASEAKKRKMSIQDVAEEKFKIAEQK